MHFYTLNQFPTGDARTVARKPKNAILAGTRICPGCGQPTGMLLWRPPYRVAIELQGHQFGDIAYFYGGDSFLVSKKFKELYEANHLGGLNGFDSVEVVRVKSRKPPRSPPPKYFRVEAQYGLPALDLVASGVKWDQPPTCPECRVGIIRSWQRIVIEEGTWTGDDAFEVRGLPGTIVVSQRFKDVCQSNGITNAEFTPIENAGHDFYAPHDQS